MSKRLIDVEFEGQPHKGERVDFDSDNEAWNHYSLKDGTHLKLKTVVTGVLRLTTAYRPDGEPIYLVKSANHVEAEAPEHLYTKPKKNKEVN